VRLALLGCGGVAEAHLNAAAKFKIPVQVTAAIDLDPARIDVVTGLAARLPDQGEVVPEGFQTVDDCLATAADRVDVVAVFLPHNVHEQFAVQLLSTDKHIMLEKPMAPTVAECERCASSREQRSLALPLATESAVR
jgi:predicted dehydrogenase